MKKSFITFRQDFIDYDFNYNSRTLDNKRPFIINKIFQLNFGKFFIFFLSSADFFSKSTFSKKKSAMTAKTDEKL